MISLKEINGVKFLQSGLLRSKHAFSTRVGGVSELPHTSSLNLAFGRGDADETVLENIRLFSEAVGIDGKSIISVPQIHSAEVKVVSRAEKGYGVYRSSPFSCDGYVTQDKDIALGVKTADCVPILMEARNDEDDVIAVSAIHAGWRGTAARIAGVGVEKLAALGAKPDKMFVAIGPCIHRCCYEVGERPAPTPAPAKGGGRRAGAGERSRRGRGGPAPREAHCHGCHPGGGFFPYPGTFGYGSCSSRLD